MAKAMIRNSKTDATVVQALNKVTLSDVREYDIKRSADGHSWLTATVWFHDEPAVQPEPDKKE